MLAQEMFMAAEVAYRRERATAQYAPRRHDVRRRPSLHLPHHRRGPLSLA